MNSFQESVKAKDPRGDEPGHGEGQDDPGEDLPARRAVDQRTLLELERIERK